MVFHNLQMYCIFVFDIYPAYSLSFLNLSWHITLTWANVQSLSFQICPLLLSFLSFPQCIHSTFCSCPKSLDTLFCFVPSSFSWFCFFEDCSSVFACCLLYSLQPLAHYSSVFYIPGLIIPISLPCLALMIVKIVFFASQYAL